MQSIALLNFLYKHSGMASWLSSLVRRQAPLSKGSTQVTSGADNGDDGDRKRLLGTIEEEPNISMWPLPHPLHFLTA